MTDIGRPEFKTISREVFRGFGESNDIVELKSGVVKNDTEIFVKEVIKGKTKKTGEV